MAGMTKSVNKLQEHIQRLRKSTAKAREKGAELVTEVLNTAETGGTAFALAVAHGRYGSDAMKVAGVPVALGLGVGAHVMALLGVGGAESHFRAIGNGAIAQYATVEGLKIGQKWAQESGGTAVRGDYSLGQTPDPVAELMANTGVVDASESLQGEFIPL